MIFFQTMPKKNKIYEPLNKNKIPDQTCLDVNEEEPELTELPEVPRSKTYSPKCLYALNFLVFLSAYSVIYYFLTGPKLENCLRLNKNLTKAKISNFCSEPDEDCLRTISTCEIFGFFCTLFYGTITWGILLCIFYPLLCNNCKTEV